jgi:hypothetical protein
MSVQPPEPVRAGPAVAWSVAILGTFLLMAVLVIVLYRVTRPEDLTASRARERVQFLSEVRQAEAALSQYGWDDPAKKAVRLPVSRAMELVLVEWQDPARARSNLVQRFDQAKAPPPAAPNPYE